MQVHRIIEQSNNQSPWPATAARDKDATSLGIRKQIIWLEVSFTVPYGWPDPT